MDSKNKNIPKLRFPEFSCEWEEKKLGDIFNEVTEKVGEQKLNTYSITAGRGFVSQKEKFGKDISGNQNPNYTALKPNQFSYNKGNSKTYKYGCIYLNKTRQTIAVPNVFISFQLHNNEMDNEFFAKLFEAHYLDKGLRRIISSSARMDGLLNVNKKNFFDLKIFISGSSEQEKIANFLTAVDERIEKLQEKQSLLEDYKKGVMHKIFKREIRFTDENNNPYPDWEEKKLGELGKTYNGLTGKTKEDFGRGSPYITYKQIFAGSKINTNNFDYVSLNTSEKQNLVEWGDIFFTTSSETPNEIGFCSVILDKVENLYLNSFCFGYRANSLDVLNPYFARFLFRSSFFRRSITKLAQGSTRYNMSKIELMKIKINLPHPDEQQKIADFLSAIDEKIEKVNAQIEESKNFKKGLLQQMFI